MSAGVYRRPVRPARPARPGVGVFLWLADWSIVGHGREMVSQRGPEADAREAWYNSLDGRALPVLRAVVDQNPDMPLEDVRAIVEGVLT